MAGKCINIRHYDSLCILPGRSTDPLSEWNPAARQRTLERTQNQFIADNPVESGPPEPECLVNHGGNISHIRDQIILTFSDRLDLSIQKCIFVFFASLGNMKFLSHSECHFLSFL